MPEAIIEKQKCGKCDADVRENTKFCYNCGASVVAVEIETKQELTESDADPETSAALADLEKRFRIDEDEGERLAKAAAERKKARVSNRKTVQYAWEAVDDANPIFLIFAAVLVLLAILAVLLTVYWR
jgi:hypothetical protein